MKKFVLMILLVFIISNVEANNPPDKSFTFIFTRLGNIKLKKSARFIAGDTNRWILDFRNGSKITYTITGRVGNNPMCGLTSKDNLGDVCAICVSKLSGDNVEIELKYSTKTFRYYAYIQR